jgi:pyridoxamine 5'-phosphate oxidase
MERFQDLNLFFKTTWQTLFRASVQRRHPMRTPVLGTIDGKQQNMRTVVLRHTEVKDRTLDFYSDKRSKKIRELIVNPHCCVVFYDPKKLFQITIKGKVELQQQNDHARKIWKNLPVKAKKDYISPSAPGTPLPSPESQLPEGWEDNAAFVEQGYPNFTLINCHVQFMDCLLLHREGHIRAQFERQISAGDWEKRWVVP